MTLPAAAQLERATLTGTVKDPSRAVLPGVTLSLVSQETGLHRDAQAGDNSSHTFSMVPVGIYTLTVTSPGLKNVTMRKDLRLGVGPSLTFTSTATFGVVTSGLNPTIGTGTSLQGLKLVS